MKRVAERIKFHQKWTDFAIFAVSLLLNLILLSKTGEFEMKIKIRSVILLMGTKMLFTIDLASIIGTKLINFYGSKDSFEIINSFERIDREVSCLS
jgi:hypothetical protein